MPISRPSDRPRRLPPWSEMADSSERPRSDLRSRFVVNTPRRIVLLMNYKCGFSSLSAAVGDNPDWSHEFGDQHTFAAGFEAGRFADHQFHVVTRDPLRRVVSYYWDWFVRKDEDFVGPHDAFNPQFVHLRKVLPERDYTTFATADRELRGTAEYFDRFFVRHLDDLWLLDEHMWPQNWVYTKVGLEPEDVIGWTISEIPALLSTLGLPPTPPINVGEGLQHERFFTAAAREVVPAIYGRDYVHFGYGLP